MPKLLWLSIGLLVSATLTAASQKGPKELVVTLKFAPQEGVKAASVALPSSVSIVRWSCAWRTGGK